MKNKIIISILLCLVTVACTQADPPQQAATPVAKVAPPACKAEADKPVNKEMPSLKIATYTGECYELAEH
ncbi:MAG: hypothetical protein ACREO2_07995, partial [Arenimonas sp.]